MAAMAITRNVSHAYFRVAHVFFMKNISYESSTKSLSWKCYIKERLLQSAAWNIWYKDDACCANKVNWVWYDSEMQSTDRQPSGIYWQMSWGGCVYMPCILIGCPKKPPWLRVAFGLFSIYTSVCFSKFSSNIGQMGIQNSTHYTRKKLYCLLLMCIKKRCVVYM